MRRLLLVEDDAATAQATRFALRAEWDVEVVGTLSDALRRVIQAQSGGGEPFLACLYDVRLPDSTGPEGVELLIVADPRLAIIVYTGTVDEQLAEQCRRFGAVDYIVKGGGVEELRMRLRFAIRRVTVPRAIHALGDLLMRWSEEASRPGAAHGAG